MIIRIIDFETCGLTAEAGGVVEVGWVDVRIEGDRVKIDSFPGSFLVNPGRPIPVEARAVHHISDDDVRGERSFEQVLPLFTVDVDVFCAHNAKFEQQFFTTDLPWLCTLKIARRLWPECPSHSNQCLRYWLGLNLSEMLAMPPHRAGPDAYVTANILKRALDEASVDDMIKWSSEPSLLPRVTFGKHKGADWDAVPTDYLQWLVKQTMDEDVLHTAKHHLESKAA
jgi:exodeoxyribonuclease X